MAASAGPLLPLSASCCPSGSVSIFTFAHVIRKPLLTFIYLFIYFVLKGKIHTKNAQCSSGHSRKL